MSNEIYYNSNYKDRSGYWIKQTGYKQISQFAHTNRIQKTHIYMIFKYNNDNILRYFYHNVAV